MSEIKYLNIKNRLINAVEIKTINNDDHLMSFNDYFPHEVPRAKCSQTF